MFQINPNGKGLVGFNGQVDTTGIINKLVEIESKRTEPILNTIDQRQTEADAWTQIKTLLEDVRATSETVSKFRLWQKKLAESSMPEVITASASKEAEPGKTNIAVDKIALNHQIASNVIPSDDAEIGSGKIVIQIGYEEPTEIKIDASLTAKEVIKKINESDLGVEAAIIQIDDTGEKYQMVLTSAEKGWKGRMTVNFDLVNGKHAIDFNSSYTQPDRWIYKNREITPPKEIGENDSSTSIPIFSGLYSGEEDLEIKFQAVNSGTVGAQNQLTVNWSDNVGRSGQLELGALNYTIGESVEVVDGVYVKFNGGTIVQNEEFTVKAKPDESGLWYVPDEEEPAKIYRPTPWRKNVEGMSPVTISGKYTGDDDVFFFKVKEAGIVGKSEKVIVEYYSEEGKKGELAVGLGYKPGTAIELSEGLKISFPAGILIKDAATEFEVEEQVSGIFWWLNNGDDIESTFSEPVSWHYPEDLDGELFLDATALRDRDGNRSNITPRISGVYAGNKNKTYTFTVEGNGTVGVPDFLNLVWNDTEGNGGRIRIDHTYNAGEAVEFDEGLKITIPKGELTDGDYLSFNAFSPVIQAAQDAVIRVNASTEGGGLTLRSGNNIFKNAIEGVTLETVKSSPEIVTISIENDSNTPKTAIKEFIESYNALLANLKASSKYDPKTKVAGPLQADNNVNFMRNRLNQIMINTVVGLPREANMSTYAGVSINKIGQLDFDEQKFDKKISGDILKVAKIFSTAADSSIKGVTLLDITDKTDINGGEQELLLTQLPSKGVYESGVLGDYIWLNEDNNVYGFSVNGRKTKNVALTEGVYNRKEFLRMMDKTLAEDPDLSNVKFTLRLDEDRLIIESELYGSNSEISVTTPMDIHDYNEDFGLINGGSVAGKDIQGSLDGQELDGLGKVLRGKKDTRFEGLRLFANIDPDEYQITVDDDDNIRPIVGTFSLTKGVSTKAFEYSGTELKKNIGVSKRIDDVNDRVSDQKKRLDRVNKSIERKKNAMIKRFSTMESAVASLKSQQNSTAALLSNL